jgi:hypothetical protein
MNMPPNMPPLPAVAATMTAALMEKTKKPAAPKADAKKPAAPKADAKKPAAPKADAKKPAAPKATKKPAAPKATKKPAAAKTKPTTRLPVPGEPAFTAKPAAPKKQRVTPHNVTLADCLAQRENGGRFRMKPEQRKRIIFEVIKEVVRLHEGVAGLTQENIGNRAGCSPTLVARYFGGAKGIVRAGIETLPATQRKKALRDAGLAE